MNLVYVEFIFHLQRHPELFNNDVWAIISGCAFWVAACRYKFNNFFLHYLACLHPIHLIQNEKRIHWFFLIIDRNSSKVLFIFDTIFLIDLSYFILYNINIKKSCLNSTFSCVKSLGGKISLELGVGNASVTMQLHCNHNAKKI